ncbi:protein of unknown function [Taphrina deformans PYCC 5710]|uniref:Uncharacterized protein n=1 Tax=Taphrina deformans (strain PYCC 5710 / ATCC 11124 / CBS 356.35 / IMI 108563 / JCM 9778 / NBRC 8474) TaxID=1097556 RepID=R4X754_TAPDE|nr:protein of unknown function [Taphrina deformans PYCC 5710]|eukprot:CCG81091.1 protein of unknown function [Taphrina deformans PYCC 5710]
MSGAVKTKEGVQGGDKNTSENEHHGEESTTGMGGSTAGTSAPSEENQAHGEAHASALQGNGTNETDKHASGHANK